MATIAACTMAMSCVAPLWLARGPLLTHFERDARHRAVPAARSNADHADAAPVARSHRRTIPGIRARECRYRARVALGRGVRVRHVRATAELANPRCGWRRDPGDGQRRRTWRVEHSRVRSDQQPLRARTDARRVDQRP